MAERNLVPAKVLFATSTKAQMKVSLVAEFSAKQCPPETKVLCAKLENAARLR